MTCTFSINSTLYGCAVSINDTVYVLSQDSNTDSVDNLCNGTYNIYQYIMLTVIVVMVMM